MTRQEAWRTGIRVFEVVANAAMVGLVVIVVGTYAHARMSSPGQTVVPPPEAPPPYRAGDVLGEDLGGVELAKKPNTLLVVVQSRCRFCTASMPFYERLAKASHPSVQIVVLTQEEAAIGRAYVTSHGFEPDAVVSIPEFARIRSTPTVILTDGTKTVRRIWTGKLSTESEAEVLSALEITR